MRGEEPGKEPFVPLPMHSGTGAAHSDPSAGAVPKEIRVVYLRYRDPNPIEFPDRPGRLAGPIFHAAGVLLREDEQFLALGEIAFRDENPAFAGRYGADLFPAYRNVLTVPKAMILERRDFQVEVPSDHAPAKSENSR